MEAKDNLLNLIKRYTKLIYFAAEKNIRIMPFSLLRTAEEQNKLFLENKSNADGYNKISPHQVGRAVDVVILEENGAPVWVDDPRYHLLGAKWKELGGRWGGDWKTMKGDIFHFEI